MNMYTFTNVWMCKWCNYFALGVKMEPAKQDLSGRKSFSDLLTFALYLLSMIL